MNAEKTKDCPFTAEHLRSLYDLCVPHYAKEHRRMRLLDAVDRGELWSALRAKVPNYQILTDTNFVSYVKQNILASVYTVVKGASIQPTSEDDKEIIVQLNIALERIWSLRNVGHYQFQAGERAALMNMGITQVGWDPNIVSGSKTKSNINKGDIVLKNIDPIKFMRDPFATSLDTAGYCMTYDKFHKSVFQEDSRYKEEFEAYLRSKNSDQPPENLPSYTHELNVPSDKNYYNLVIYWIKKDGDMWEVHTVNSAHILYSKKIIPARFPFAILYCNDPANSLVGVSEPAKILTNNIAYNFLTSIAATAEYKNQRPPKFISSQSGLNIQSFSKHGDEADRTFIVNGPADKAVTYQQFPQASPALVNMLQNMQYGIQTVSGVDGRYTGRDTGSVITTGGVEDMLNRVTLIDTPKIATYESYAKALTELILSNYLEYSQTRSYFYKPPQQTKWASVEVEFPKIDANTVFNYELNISSELPRNKQRIAEMANQLMEKQMQYRQEGSSVQLLTEEEWLMFQDLPNKEYLLERMGIQRQRNATQEVSQVLFEYSELVRRGMNPNDAIMAVAQGLQESRTGQMPMPDPAMTEAGVIPQNMQPMV